MPHRSLNVSLFIILPLFAVLGGCTKKSVHPFANNITASDLNAHVTALTAPEMEGRFTASKGEAKAARYIAQHFDIFGLESPFWNGSYVQDFRVSMAHSLSNAVSVSRDQFSFSSETHGLRLHPLSSKGTVTGGIGLGSGPEDFSSVNFSDYPIATLMLSSEKDGKELNSDIATLATMGADAVLITATSDSLFKPRLFDLSGESFSIPVLFVSPKVSEDLFSVESESEPVPIRTAITIEVTATAQPQSSKNVIGQIDIPDTDSTVIIGAHFDHLGDGAIGSNSDSRRNAVHPGADDNASGIAVLLELADYLSANRDSLRYDILFIAFSAEEIGLLGSQFYVENPVLPLEDTAFMINLDMVGQLRGNQLFVRGIDPAITPGFSRKLREANTHGLQLTFSAPDDFEGRSDHLSFSKKGVLSAHLFTGGHDAYHTPADNPDKLNILGMRMIAQYVNDLVLD